MSATSGVAAGMGLALAVAAGLADRRRRLRRDLDRIGWVDWRTVQILALMEVAVAIGIALKR